MCFSGFKHNPILFYLTFDKLVPAEEKQGHLSNDGPMLLISHVTGINAVYFLKTMSSILH